MSRCYSKGEHMRSGRHKFSGMLDFGFKIGQYHVDDIEVEVSGEYDYDPGCWRTSNGDGWPPTMDIVDFDIDNPDEVVRLAREQLDGIDIDDAAILKAAHAAAEEQLMEVDISEWSHDDGNCGH